MMRDAWGVGRGAWKSGYVRDWIILCSIISSLRHLLTASFLTPLFLTPSFLTGSTADSASEKLASLPEAG